jgi:hypothetical protein
LFFLNKKLIKKKKGKFLIAVGGEQKTNCNTSIPVKYAESLNVNVFNSTWQVEESFFFK